MGRMAILNGLFMSMLSLALLSIPGVTLENWQYWLAMSAGFGILTNSVLS